MYLFSRFFFLSLLGVFCFSGSLGATTSLSAAELEPPKAWAVFQEPDYGTTLYYPSNWFEPAGMKDESFIFTSKNDDAVLSLKVIFDDQRTGAAATVSQLKTGTGAHRITDIQSGEMWYELKMVPTPETQIFSRTLYSCKERVVSQVSLTYPKASASSYEKMLKKMKRRFSQGVGVKTPVRECS